MSTNPFRKSLDTIDFADIQRLIDDSIAESNYLDYKQEMPTRIDLQKEVLGFANNAGGYLVIGIKTKKPQEVPEEIIGIPQEDNLKERVVAIIRDNAKPPFVPSVHLVEIPSDKTKCVLIVYSHESSDAHRASDGYYYYRTENQTIPIRPEFVAKILGKEKVKENIKKAIADVYDKMYPDGTGIDVKDNYWLGVICCPVPPESINLSVFSETDWYYKVGMNALATSGLFDKKSTANSFKVFKGSAASPSAFIEYFENGIVLSCYKLYFKNVHEDELRNKLNGFLELIKDTYNKNNFNGGLLLIIGLGNIEKRKWTTGNIAKDLLLDICPSTVPYLELREETTVSALNSDLNGTSLEIITKWKRHFNIH